jgi:prepilin-type N-terminal cleavage/methylation domain-containing protein
MKYLNNQSGFSMVEVLASMAIFAVAAVGLVATTVSTTKSNSTSRHTTVASALIQDKIEELRAMDPSLNPADFAPGTHVDAANPMTALGEPGGIYVRSWNVTANVPAIGLAEVVVTLAWNTPDGPRSLRAASLLCQTATCT